MSHPIIEELAVRVNAELEQEIGPNRYDPAVLKANMAKVQALDFARGLDNLTENDNEETLYWVSRYYQRCTMDVFRGKSSLLKTLFDDMLRELGENDNRPTLHISRLLAVGSGPLEMEEVVDVACERQSFFRLELKRPGAVAAEDKVKD